MADILLQSHWRSQLSASGLWIDTGVTGGTFEAEVPMRKVTPYSQRLWSGDGVKVLAAAMNE